MAVMLIYIVI